MTVVEIPILVGARMEQLYDMVQQKDVAWIPTYIFIYNYILGMLPTRETTTHFLLV
jgi:hypothetical protein